MEIVGICSRINVYTGLMMYLAQDIEGNKKLISKSTFYKYKKVFIKNQ